MTVRDDITVNFAQSPRIIVVETPSTSLNMQDLVDTLREREQDLGALDDNHLLDASGKEELGGGVKVGITVSLNNARIQFKERTQSIADGYADSVGTTHLIDNDGYFITAGVQPGATIINFDGKSLATVIQVVSEFDILHTTLNYGAVNSWIIGDEYRIWNKIQCDVEGGNLVALDSDGYNISPILPSAFTQVVRTSSSSATLQELDAIQFASYNGGVTVKPSSPYSGTAFPVGTLQQPVNNLADAHTIANVRGLNNIYVLESLTLDSGDFSGYVFLGTGSRNNITIQVDIATIVVDTRFEDVTILGNFNSDKCHLHKCVVGNITYSGEFIEDCILTGIVTLIGSSEVHIYRCVDANPGPGVPTIDLSGFSGELSIREYVGGIEIKNKTTADTVAIDLITGRVIIDSTVTAGTIRIRGLGTVEDNSTGTAVIDTTSLVSNTSISQAVWNAPTANHTAIGSFGEKVGKKLLTLAKFLGLK